MLVVSDYGLLAFAAEWLLSLLPGLTCRLFKNNYTPLQSSVVGDFTEADFTGYSAQALTGWGAAYINGGGDAETDNGAVLFHQTGTGTTNNVYGYFVTDGSGSLVYAERNAAAPVAMDTTGKVYVVSPKLTLGNL